eukprot:scaffold70166_cov59-Attheya_sp.AAC.7
MGDWNADVREHDPTKFFKPHGMREVILEKHGENAPPTWNMGSSPIDGIWATSSLDIARGGYLNFEEGLPGNHHTLWADITYQSALGHHQPVIIRRGWRRLKLNDPRVVERYLRYRKAHAQYHQLREKHLSNERNAQFPSKSSADETHEANDKLTRGGGVAWSPSIEKARRELCLVRSLIKRRLGKRVSSSLIRRREKQLKQQYHTLTLVELRRQLRKSKASYRKLKGQAEHLRVSFIESLASARAAANQTTQAAELRVMETRQQQQELGRNIRKLSVTFHPEYTVHTDKGPMERASLNEYSRRLHMAKGSPLMVSPLVQEVSYLGVSTQSQQILEGTYTTPPGIDPYTDQWLSQLGWACPEANRQHPTSIFRACGMTTAKHISSWTYSKEKTAPGHSELHPAHWRRPRVRTRTSSFYGRSMGQLPHAQRLLSIPLATWSRPVDTEENRYGQSRGSTTNSSLRGGL